MTSIHKSREGVKSDGLCKLLLQTDTQAIGSSLSTESITQKEKEMRMRIKKRKKLLINY